MSISANFPNPVDEIDTNTLDQVSTVKDELTEKVQTVSKRVFVNIGLEVLKLGFVRTNVYRDQIIGHTNEAKETQTLLKKLIDLNGKLSLVGEQNEVPVTDDLRASAQLLKDKGIETFDLTAKTLSREKIAEIKTNLGMRIDTIKSEIQIIFSSLIQPKISEMNSLLDTLKMIEKYQTKLIETIVANSTKR